MPSRSVVWLAVVACLAPSVAMAQSQALASYRAVYDLSADDSGGEVASTAAVGGRMAMEFVGSRCRGYRSKMRLVTEGEDADGNAEVTDARTDTLETDGGRFEFTSETYLNQALSQQATGVATRTAEGIAVKLTKPGKQDFALGRQVLFPTEQMQRVLAAAAEGRHFVAMDVFDGSDTGKVVYATAAVIGQQSTAADDFGDDTLIGKAGFAGLPHWPVTVSYFDKTSGHTDDTPTYVTSFVVYANGIGRALRIDYGTFALVGHLSHLDMLPTPKC